MYEHWEKLKKMLCAEAEEISRKGDLSAGDLEAIDKLTSSIKNIEKILMYEEEYSGNDGYSDDGYSMKRSYGRNSYNRDSGYSGAGEWSADIRGNYGRNSYARRGTHYVRGHYSRADGKERMMEHLNNMMREAGTETERQTVRSFMDTVDRL